VLKERLWRGVSWFCGVVLLVLVFSAFYLFGFGLTATSIFVAFLKVEVKQDDYCQRKSSTAEV